MRQLIVVVMVALTAATVAFADDTAVRIGDVPRTGSHFLNARSAALCGASSASGGLPAIYRNPAVGGLVGGAEGFATLRYNVKTRDYLPEGEAGIDASDDGLLLSQAAAVKTSDTWTFGFAYATPAYRSLELSGAVEIDERPLESYTGEFTGSFRTFEAVLVSNLWEGRFLVGGSAGIATIDETGRVVSGPDLEESWEIDGVGACYAIGLLFRATERIDLGFGYRFPSEIEVDGTGRGAEGATGTFETSSVVTGGVTVRALERLALHASFVRDGWHQAGVTMDQQNVEAVDGVPTFDDPLMTVAAGAEFDVTEKVVLRAGYSMQTTDGLDGAAVPESAVGLGGTYTFSEYYVDAAYVHESFEVDGESGDLTNSGLYLSLGYGF